MESEILLGDQRGIIQFSSVQKYFILSSSPQLYTMHTLLKYFFFLLRRHLIRSYYTKQEYKDKFKKTTTHILHQPFAGIVVIIFFFLH